MPRRQQRKKLNQGNKDEQFLDSENELSKPRSNRANRVIRMPIDRETYLAIVDSHESFRRYINNEAILNPEIFPEDFNEEFLMHEKRDSKKLKLGIRRITHKGVNYTIHPSFIMPYCSGLTDEVETPIFLRKFNVPYWALAFVFGKNAMYWYRIEAALGRFNIPQTTIQQASNLPEHIAADEKHTKLKGNKVYAATTVGAGCILGCEVVQEADNPSMKEAYGVFKQEVSCVDENYSPKTVNLDGWNATNNAWRLLFPSTVIITCILHFYIKIRDRSKKKYNEVFNQVADKFWNCYDAETKAAFSQRVRRFSEWATKDCNGVPQLIQNMIKKLRTNVAKYSIAYEHSGCHRTSNMLDRLMQRMNRHLFATQYFHGTRPAATLALRAWCLIYNFAPCAPTKLSPHTSPSPAMRINKKSYHDKWLQNLMVSASLVATYRPSNYTPPIPLE